MNSFNFRMNPTQHYESEDTKPKLSYEYQQASGNAVVPLRSHANENSFFGSEGLTMKDIQDDFGCELFNKPHSIPAFGKPEYENTIDYHMNDFFIDEKENIFAVNVDLIEPQLVQPTIPLVEVPKPRLLLPKLPTDSIEDLSLSSDSVISSSIASSSSESSPKMIVRRRKRQKKLPEVTRSSSNFKIADRKRARQFHCYGPREPRSLSSESDVSDESLPVVEKAARFDGDLYTPRLQRGNGDNKEGMCPICEPKTWLKIKQSAYWYHMNYHHGISATTGRPYDPPSDFQLERLARSQIDEAILQLKGYCARCDEWVVIMTKYLDESERKHQGKMDDLIDIETVNYMSWYRHCQRCGPKKNQK